MNILGVIFINLKKLKERKGKALFLILPIAILFALSIVISSQASNFKEAIDQSIFGTIDEQSKLIEIVKEFTMDPRQGGMGQGQPGEMMDFDDTRFSDADLEVIKDIDYVETAEINSALPISNISTTEVFEDTELSLSNVTGIDSSTAALLTDTDFEYVEGEPIPIILNANSFLRSYEDWGGETEYTVDFRAMREEMEESSDEERVDPRNATPIKTEAIEYDKDELIGKTVTINFGGLETLQTYTIERDMGVMTFVQLTEEELQEQIDARKEAISQYWDYDMISTPLTYEFIIVGITEEAGSNSVFIPTDAANQIMVDYIQNQLDSQITEIPTDILDDEFTGLTYDGIELQTSDPMMGMMRGMGGGMGVFGGGPGQQEASSSTIESYEIPGLVVELSSDGSNEVEGIYEDANVYEDAVHYGDTITIKISSVTSREQVVKDLNKAGYAYQDLSDYNVVSDLKSTVNKISIGLVIAFITITIAVIILTMSKFVSESRKEIGIFRSMGITKFGIIKMFVSQAIIYTGIGYAIGMIIGILLNVVLATPLKAWFDNFVATTIEETFSVVNQVDSSVFLNFDWSAIGIFSLILVVLTVIISYIPAQNASTVSPVEAIKSE